MKGTKIIATILVSLALLVQATAFSATIRIMNTGNRAVVYVEGENVGSVDVGIVANGTVESVSKASSFSGMEKHTISGNSVAISAVSQEGMKGEIAEIVFSGNGMVVFATARAYDTSGNEIPASTEIASAEKQGSMEFPYIAIAAVVAIAILALLFLGKRKPGRKGKKR